MQKIIAVNAGSSSLKFQLIQMPEEEVVVEGLIERIGLGDSNLIYKFVEDGKKVKNVKTFDCTDHTVAVKELMNLLIEKQFVKDLNEIKGVGHRIVHGGTLTDSMLVTDEVIAEITKCVELAPLHNPGGLAGIKSFKEALPDIPQVVVFDTSFHQTMEPEAYMYALPYEWYTKYGVRKYGFHGTSHKFIMHETAKFLGKKPEELRIISAHIGNGASLAAIKYGKCVDTSMGFTPLDGVVMGSRSGSFDPAIIPFMMEKEDLSISEISNIINKKSGYLGIYGKSSDSREVREAASNGDELANLTIALQSKSIADTIAKYYVYMGGADAIVFTAGIGENSAGTRADIVGRIGEALDIRLDKERNSIRGKNTVISTDDSKVKVILISTNEELMIVRDVIRLSK